MQIGELAKRHIGQIITHCETVDHDEFVRLLDPSYSKQAFGLNFPYFADLEGLAPELHRRYWTQVYLVRGRQVRVTSQWYEPSRSLLAEYLASRGIATKTDFERLSGVTLKAVVASPAASKPVRGPQAARTSARYKMHAIGNAQNSFVRNVLGNLGYESFNQKDWETTKEQFSHRCAYCGIETEQLVMEHAIPINKVSLGEHRLGNLVPSCKKCNDAKGDKHFRSFLEGNTAAITRIEQHMDSHNYVPLETNEQITMVLEMAHKEVAALAERYVKILNELFVQP